MWLRQNLTKLYWRIGETILRNCSFALKLGYQPSKWRRTINQNVFSYILYKTDSFCFLFFCILLRRTEKKKQRDSKLLVFHAYAWQNSIYERCFFSPLNRWHKVETNDPFNWHLIKINNELVVIFRFFFLYWHQIVQLVSIGEWRNPHKQYQFMDLLYWKERILFCHGWCRKCNRYHHLRQHNNS